MKRKAKICIYLFILLSYFLSKYAFSEELKLAPGFETVDLKNNTVSLNSFKDKQPVFLLFWTTWCPFCRQELKEMNDIYARLNEEGVEFLAINVAEPFYRVVKFVDSYNLNYRVLLDESGYIAGDYKIVGVPTYVLVNKNGYIVFQDHYFPKGRYEDLISQ